MLHNRFRIHASFSLMVATALLYGGHSFAQAQNPRKNAGPTIAYAGVQISGYEKLTASLTSFHLTGKDTYLEFQEQGRALHSLHAEDVRVTKTGNGLTAELSGNIHYTQLNARNRDKIIDGVAAHAVYKQSKTTENTLLTLTQAHVRLFREGNEIATLNADQVAANPQNETLTGTGAVRILAQIEGHRVEVTADQILWDRHANTLEVSGKLTFRLSG